MTQSSDLGNVGNGSGSVVRGKFNTSSLAVVSESSGSSAPSPTYAFMDWRNNTAKLIRERNAANNAWTITQNYGATTNPTASTDETDGYDFGSEYYNTTGKNIFQCFDPEEDTAIWRSITNSTNYYTSVKQYGAKGDGTTDDTVACQNAFNVAAAVKGIVYFPPGRYILSNMLYVSNSSIQILGAGQHVTELRWISHTVGITITSNTGSDYHKVSNLTLSTYFSEGTALYLNYSGQIVDVGGGNLNTMDRLHTRFMVEDITICGTSLIDSGTPTNGFINGIIAQAAIYCTVRDSTIVGVRTSDTTGAANTYGIVFVGNPTSGNFQNGRPVVLSVIGCKLAFLDKGYYIVNAEGIFLKNSSLFACNTGIHNLSETNNHPHFTCNNNLINSAVRCVMIQGAFETHLYRNNLVLNSFGSGSVAIEASSGAVSIVVNKNVITSLGSNQFGAVLHGQKGVFSNNILKGNMTYGVWLTGTSAGWKGHNNVYAGTMTSNVLNQGTGNTVT